ncbi:MAG: ubiquitin-like protein atg8 [Watsoniomyces obsoletus]|nr:MAG: ubiquitin-like protein atg8 [Watsoniomyces obsoletus]
MSKRPLIEEDVEFGPANKRLRYNRPDRLSRLSDELLLRVFSFLPVPTLASCHRLSHRLQSIAGDSQIWKSLYYDRFVRPRASRIPGIREPGAPLDRFLFSSRLSRWLEDDVHVRRGPQTNWKRQYKLRHNWSRGSARISEIPVAERPVVPRLLVQLHEGVILTADINTGLRAWRISNPSSILASISFKQKQLSVSEHVSPSSLAVSSSPDDNGKSLQAVVGFDNGTFIIYQLDLEAARWSQHGSHVASSASAITAVAAYRSHIATLDEDRTLRVYRCSPIMKPGAGTSLDSPRLLYSLRSYNTCHLSSLSLRPRAGGIVISVVYALPVCLGGWSVGLQELQLSLDGEVQTSRTASALPLGYHPLSPPSSPSSGTSTPQQTRSSSSGSQPPLSRPTSLSYSHPYLLAAHPDNTLTLYLVTSSSNDLSISAGRRLWGHTSAVSGAYVGSRGKAVSVSSPGDELRVWELEGEIDSSGVKRRLDGGDLSVQVRPERITRDGDNDDREEADLSIRLALDARLDVLGSRAREPAAVNPWVGFDDERVVLLRQQALGPEALVIHDFA